MTTLLALTLLTVQNPPQDIPKAELPKTAACVVCASNGEGHGEEKPAAGVRYEGKTYFFCGAKEVEEFKKDPEAFIPPILPRPAPKLIASDLTGQAFSMDGYKGKWVLLDFWATWCGPCVKGMPALDALYKAREKDGLVVLGVSIDEDVKKARDFQARRKFTYPILLDDTKEPTWAAWKVRAIPAIFLVNPEGQIVAQWRGKIDHKEIEKTVEGHLGKR